MGLCHTLWPHKLTFTLWVVEKWLKPSLHIGFRMRLLHCIAIFYYLPWFCSIKVSNKILQRYAENAWGNQMCKRAFSLEFFYTLKLRCDSLFQRAFTACSCVFKVIMLAWADQGNYFENAIAFSKRMRKTLVATQLKFS